MKLKDIVKQLANRINQPHVIEVYLRQVYAKGFAEGAKQPSWTSVKDELPPYNKKVLLLNTKNETIGYQIFTDECDIKTYCDWFCISYWRLANFPE